MTDDRYGLQVNNAELVGQIADIDSRFPNVRVLSYSTYEMVEEQDGGGEGDGGAVRGGGVSRSAGGGEGAAEGRRERRGGERGADAGDFYVLTYADVC